jgi:PAS domain S-box-containing protein
MTRRRAIQVGPRRERSARSLERSSWTCALAVVAIAVIALTAATAAAQGTPRAQPRRVLTYGGDSDFPPYEYLDANGRPQGFNVELVRALSRELGVPLEIHLWPWREAVARFDAGEVDLMSLAYSDRRAQRYELLWQTWTLHQSLVFRAGRKSYPSGFDDLARETVAVEERSLLAELLRQLPERERPAIIPVPSQLEALMQLVSGKATGVGGNDLTLRHGAAALGIDDLVVVPVKSVSYHLAARRDGRLDPAAVVAALQRLASKGEIDRLVEEHLSRPSRQSTWRDQVVPIGIALGVMLLVVGGFILWTRQLRKQVANRTEELERSLLEVKRSGRARERALDALQASESRYRSLIQNMLGGLLVCNDKGRIVLANPSSERLFGYDPGELVGKSVEVLVPAADVREARAVLKRAFGQALGRITEWEGRRKDGTVFPFELSMFDFDGPSGRLYAGNLVDISDRREISRMKDEFVSVVSHELRTPLTSMKASMQLLLADDDELSHDEGRELLTVALNNTERLVRIINDMLDVAKIEAGRLELKRRASAPAELVQMAVLNVEHLARTTSIHLATAVAPVLPHVMVDPDRLVQALVNLLSNALKFAPRNSTVTVGAESPLFGTLRFWVHDSGKGIPPDQLARLFHKFQQLDSSDARRVPGTGLGLAITKALVEQHGGRVGVSSRPGEGTTFYFTLPCDAVTPATAQVPEDARDDAA